MPGLPEMRLEHITEIEIQALLSDQRIVPSVPREPENHLQESIQSNKSTPAVQEEMLPRKEAPKHSTSVPKDAPTSRHVAGTVEEKGILLGETEAHTPVRWQPSINGNPHMMIAGLPGMGKTTCLVSMCSQLMSEGITPVVFSYHDDIDEKLAALFPNLRLVDCSNLGFNPMRISADQSHGHLENAGQLRDIFAAIFPELGDLQRELIRTAIKTTYESLGWAGSVVSNANLPIPAFSAFLAELRSIRRPDAGTRAVLARLGELDDYGFFGTAHDEQTLLASNAPIVLQIHRTNNEAVQRAYASFAFYRIYQDMFARGRQERITHAIIFDEAHKASKLKLIPTMAKECRKFGLALVLASQESRDFDPALFTAVANYLILRVTEDTAKHLSKNIVASDRQRAIADRLKQLPKYDAMWLSEGRRLPVQLRLHQLQK